MNRQEWSQIEEILVAGLPAVPPILCVVDYLEETNDNDARIFLDFHSGLLREVYRQSQSPVLFDRLQIRIAVRASTLWHAAGRHERVLNLAQSPSTVLLHWRSSDLAEFMRRRAASLDERFILNPTSEQIFGRICGKETIHNADRNVNELIDNYIARHTSGTPRDLINISNVLARHARYHKTVESGPIEEDFIRQVVSDQAQLIGQELLNQTSTALEVLPSAVGLGASSGNSDERHLYALLRNWISQFEYDIFDQELLEDQVAGFPLPDLGTALVDHMWRHRVLGVVAKSEKSPRRTHVRFARPSEHRPPLGSRIHAFSLQHGRNRRPQGDTF